VGEEREQGTLPGMKGNISVSKRGLSDSGERGNAVNRVKGQLSVRVE